MIKGQFYKLGLTLLLAALLAGCGGSHSSNSSSTSLITVSPSDDALAALTSGATVDVTVFNGTSMYVLITAEPSDKQESNYYNELLSETYSFALSSTTGASTSQSVLNSVVSSKASVAGATNAVYSAAQIASDNRFRAKENELLDSKAKQFSPETASLRKSSAPQGTDIEKGDRWTDVNIYDFSTNINGGLTQINTTCRYISSHAYFFVEDEDYGTEITYSDLEKVYGPAFDSIYNTSHTHFGTENDTDNNGKIIIVFSGKLSNGVLGYFNSSDKYSSSRFSSSDSNEGDIIYITTGSTYNNGDSVTANDIGEVMAHEFQHMIYFDQHYNKGVKNTYIWLNEALSQAAQYYSYGANAEIHQHYIKRFLRNSSYYAYNGLSLTYWSDYNYGFGAIFIRYLIDQYGDEVVKNMCSTKYVGIKAVEKATGVNFNTLFTNFTRALVFLGTSHSANSVYQFTSSDLTELQTSGRGGLLPLSKPTLIAGSTLSEDKIAIYPYSINFYKCSGTFGTVTLSGRSVIGTVFRL
jgi:hypothetical protein